MPKKKSSKGFTLIELALAMALSLITGLAINAALSAAMNASNSFQAKQLETSGGLSLSGLIKNDFKQASNVILDASSDSTTQYIKITQVSNTDLASGAEGHLVVYRIGSNTLSRGTGALGAAVSGLSYSSIMPSLPSSMAQAVTCTYPCGTLYDATGAATTTASQGVRFVLTGLQYDVDSADRVSHLFDNDSVVYSVPKLEAVFTTGGSTATDAAADAAALAS